MKRRLSAGENVEYEIVEGSDGKNKASKVTPKVVVIVMVSFRKRKEIRLQMLPVLMTNFVLGVARMGIRLGIVLRRKVMVVLSFNLGVCLCGNLSNATYDESQRTIYE